MKNIFIWSLCIVLYPLLIVVHYMVVAYLIVTYGSRRGE